MPYRIPSHVTRNNGCARKRSEAKYPSLWPEFAWSPCLGNTGATLREHIRQADGTLTNMDPADWVLSEGRLALDYDGSDDHVAIGANHSAAAGSFSTWVNARSQTANDRVLTSVGGYLFIEIDVSALNLDFVIFDGAGKTVDGPALTLNRWTHLVGTWDSTNIRFYVNGVQYGPTAAGALSVVDAIQIGGVTTVRFDGLIDDTLLYNRPIPLATVQQLYSLGRGGWAEKRKRRVGIGDAGYTPFAEFLQQSQPIFDKYVPVPY